MNELIKKFQIKGKRGYRYALAGFYSDLYSPTINQLRGKLRECEKVNEELRIKANEQAERANSFEKELKGYKAMIVENEIKYSKKESNNFSELCDKARTIEMLKGQLLLARRYAQSLEAKLVEMKIENHISDEYF